MKTSNIVKEQDSYKVNFDGITEDDVKKYADVFDIEKSVLTSSTGKMFVPGHYLIGLLRGKKLMDALIQKKFPLSQINNFSISSPGTKENKLFSDEPVFYLLQQRCRLDSGVYTFWIEIHRTSDQKIIISGIFNLSGVEASKFMEL